MRPGMTKSVGSSIGKETERKSWRYSPRLANYPKNNAPRWIMRIWGGMTLEEVADATAVPLSTAASRYRYALERLRERLKPWRRGYMKEQKMDEYDHAFESYLRQFEPQRPGALTHGQTRWRRQHGTIQRARTAGLCPTNDAANSAGVGKSGAPRRQIVRSFAEYASRFSSGAQHVTGAGQGIRWRTP
jgi:Sigma-70, region 4